MRWIQTHDGEILLGGPQGVRARVTGVHAHVEGILGPVLDEDYPTPSEARRAAAYAARYWLGTNQP
jgi:hypothetical protein